MDFRARNIKGAVYFRYLWLSALELVVLFLFLRFIRRWIALPDWLFWSGIAAWIAKDVALFPLVWKAYDTEASSATAAMIGTQGIAQGRLDPTGHVLVRGERWRAEREGRGPLIETGSAVRVRKVEGLTLYVVPEDNENSDAGSMRKV